MKALVLAVGLGLAAAAAAQGDDILQKAINSPSINYSFYGDGYTAKVVKDGAVPGGQAYHVDVKAKGATPYAIGAQSPIGKPIAKGDAIVLAIWARAPRANAGETVPLSFMGVVGPAPGYAAIVGGPADLTSEWKIHQVRGTASADFAPGTANVALHLAGTKATIDLGPVFVLDFGHGAPAH